MTEDQFERVIYTIGASGVIIVAGIAVMGLFIQSCISDAQREINGIAKIYYTALGLKIDGLFDVIDPDQSKRIALGTEPPTVKDSKCPCCGYPHCGHDHPVSTEGEPPCVS